MGHRSAWDRLAEALGIKTEVNWDAVGKRRQMQQYGTMDRRDKQGPMPYFRSPAMQQRTQQDRSSGANPNAMAQIPAGADAPGQMGRPNPLFAPPPRSRSPLTTPPNSPQSLGGEREDDDEGQQY